MHFEDLTIIFLLINFIISLPIWQIIYKHISKKPLLEVTLVDWIYRDIIFYNITLGFCLSAGIIHTLLYDDKNFSLSFELGLFYSICINISTNLICISLVFSAGLRLISLVKNSEAAGDYPQV
jgi:hypothetical protein